ncbi:SpoVK/Ycf46/Vps4 family AAA+-type ATPase [Sinobaca qinghaiensis]|uniref:SpoVK/Ycf46/Vps4 family AAA+-type ATPase n=1 Tax=Sinobaca qinghaiensis TaxID=342944 RepID=A0A419V5R5_9BACL|nr:AAA family ATPase [Sinobaca qinghaiensis]RKD75237.1 SpoVK/Ycf46/Vps4 family AAA+-type ATPase [Sinobaca qinghaiensis]
MTISSTDQLKEKIEAWEKQPSSLSIDAVQEFIGQIDAADAGQRRLAARAYAVLAKERFSRRDRFDPLIRSWVEQGLEWDDTEKDLLFLKGLETLFAVRDMAFSRAMAPIRETDQSSARKKAAEQLKANAETEREQLKQAADILQQSTVDEALFAEHLPGILEAVHKGTALYTKVAEEAEEYLETASGSFYSPEQVKKLKLSIQELQDVKKEWESQFASLDQYTAMLPGDPLTELDQMIGLEQVKDNVHRMYHYLQYQKQRKDQGYQWKDERSLHMILTGNPGTGKTMLARMLAKIYHHLGILPRDEVLEADRSQLVGAYVGQTEEKTMHLVKEAVGGVLFIDEAYSLRREGMSGNDFGQTAVDTLVSAMTSGEYAGSFAIILAGYPEEMRQFLHSNPGLRSRFPESNHIHLPDYSMKELTQIAEKTAIDNDFMLNDASRRVLQERLEKEQVDETFGNGRTAKNIIMDAIFQKGSKIGEKTDVSVEDYSILTPEDMSGSAFSLDEDARKEPMIKLEEMIGLQEVKNELKKLASFISVQKKRKEEGAPSVPLQLHTVFTGEAGTGKTTVAKLYAGILKEMGFLKRGHTIVCGRSDLVAEYTGQTAVKTRKKIREALGGVLFIDEAYALATGSRSDFGKEALDTLVEEMTKHDENLVVILSGYAGPMDHLLEINPGLRSRFKKTFYFPPYSAEELLEITRLKTKEYGYTCTEAALEVLKSAYERMDTSGNARFAEDMAEEMFQQQAGRVMDTAEGNLHELNETDAKKAAAYKEKESIKGDR